MKDRLDRDKPWAKLRKSRKAYEADKPWKRARMSREKFEEMVSIIPDALIDEIKINADAEALLEGIFGQDAFGNISQGDDLETTDQNRPFDALAHIGRGCAS